MLGLLCASALALTLDEALRRVETDGADAALIQRQAAAAAATVRGQALAALLPKVSATGGYTVNEREVAFDPSALFTLPDELAALVDLPESDPIVVNEKTYWSGSLTVVQPLFSGAALPAWSAAQAMARAAEVQADASRDQLRLGVARAFWAAYLSRERLRLTTDGVARAEASLALARARESLGAGRAIDTAQAGVALARARRELALAEAGRVEAEEGLARLLGVASDVPLERPTPRDVAVAGVEAGVVAAREAPGVRAAEARAVAARQTRLATDLGWMPSVSGRFTEAYSENVGFSGETWNWQVAVTADWSLFDGGLRVAKQREAAFNAEAAGIAAARERAIAEADARTLWAQLEAAREARTQAKAERELAERALTLAESAYALGALTFLELWQSRQMRDGAELAELAADMQLDLAAIALEARVGVR